MKEYNDNYQMGFFNNLKEFAEENGFEASYEGDGFITLHYEHNGAPAAVGFSGSYGKQITEARLFIINH